MGTGNSIDTLNDRDLPRPDANHLPSRCHSPIILCTPGLLSGVNASWRHQCNCFNFLFCSSLWPCYDCLLFKKRTAQMGRLVEFLVNDRRNFNGCLGDVFRPSFGIVHILSAIKGPSAVLSGCSFVDRWILGSTV